jgi:hypothetical protein
MSIEKNVIIFGSSQGIGETLFFFRGTPKLYSGFRKKSIPKAVKLTSKNVMSLSLNKYRMASIIH